jgi:hypothetical protein
MSAEVTALIDISDAIGRTSRLVDAVQSDHDDRGVDLVLQCLLREEIDSLNALSDLERGAKRIADSVERIQQAATRRSRFIAITAMVESAKITVGGAVLSQVSEDIRQLSEELADAGTEARRAIAVVLNQTAERLNPLMESIERVRMMEVAR